MTRSLIPSVRPTFEPVGLQEVLDYCRESGTDLNTFVESMITAAREVAEAITHRTLVTTTLKLTMDDFPGTAGRVNLPGPPLVSVSSVAYVDTDAVTRTLVENTDYTVDTEDTETPGIYPCYGCWWPATLDHPKAVAITYVAGYTQAQYAERWLQGIKVWICEAVLTQLDHPESVTAGTILSKKSEELTARLLGPYIAPVVV